MNERNPVVLTPDQWHFNNASLLQEVESLRNEWKKKQVEARRLAKESSHAAFSAQVETTQKLAKTAREVFHLRKSLHDAIDELAAETIKLRVMVERMERIQHTLQQASLVNDECLQLRMKRKLTDVVHDFVQEALLKECKCLRHYEEILEEKLKDIERQTDRNLLIKTSLERDWSDKEEAYHIDVTCGHITNGEASMQFPFSGTTYNAEAGERWTNPEEWIEATNERLRKSQDELESSKYLRNVTEDIVRAFAVEIRGNCDDVDLNLVKRVAEVESAAFQMKNQVKRVADDIAKAEIASAEVQKSMRSLNSGPLQVAQSRLTKRIQKPISELLTDLAQNGLNSELSMLDQSLDSLKQHYNNIEQCLEKLHSSRRKLLEEIEVKRNSVDIDKIRCRSVRVKFPSQTKLLGH